VLALTGLTGCEVSSTRDPGAPGSQATSGTLIEDRPLKFAVITHGAPGDSFWDVVMKGAEQAASDLGDTVSYQGSGVPSDQAAYVDAAVNDGVDGLVVSLANADALKPSLARARAAGIPFITVNSGQQASAALGAITHVGQDERLAGRAAGERIKQAGVGKALCVIHEAGNVGLEERCAGLREGFGGPVENLQVDIANLATAQTTIRTKLEADSSVDGIMALVGSVGVAAATAERDAGRTGVTIGTFDLSPEVTDEIAAGEITFAVDQQQYLQGYLPVQFLHLYRRNANTVGGGQPVYTGPGFVTKDNVAEVAELAAKGTR
jgi:simple sugar transport system substrate-binding protein